MCIHIYNPQKALAIFSCYANTKIPSTTHGFKDAKFGIDLQTIIENGYNVAISLKPSGLCALDLDDHNFNSSADEELKALESKLGKLPKTVVQLSATGNGKHLIFSAHGITNPKNKISENIEVKYNGALMWTPSVINGKQYQIIDGLDENGNFAFAELPKAWLDFINKPDKQSYQKTIKQKADLSAYKQRYQNVDIVKMFDNCQFLQHCKDNAEVLSEPEWFSMISILAQIDGTDDLIHELSAPFPTYSFEETQRKIEYAKNFGFSQTCNYIATTYGYCLSCPVLKGEN